MAEGEGENAGAEDAAPSTAMQTVALERARAVLDPALKDGFSGGCFCGAVTYRVAGAPLFAYLCHCTDCRRINGSAFHTGVAARQAEFSVTAGKPVAFIARSETGNTITRWHCSACGSQLYSTTSADTFLLSIKAGSVTSAPHATIRPVLQIYADSMVPWADPPPDLLTYARGIRGEKPVNAGH